MFFQKPPLGTQLDWSNPLNKGLVMHLAANEGHGDKLQDLSMYGNHGTMHNFAYPPTAASGWNPGRNGIGLNFDGVDDCINCGNKVSLTDAITISAWVNIVDTPDMWCGVVSKGSGVASVYGIRYSDHDLIGFLNDVNIPSAAPGMNLDWNRWYHAILTGTKTHGELYINGESIGGINDVNLITSTAGDLFIGKLSYVDLYFKGSIDEVRILNRAMTAKEVLDYYINPWQVYLDEDD